MVLLLPETASRRREEVFAARLHAAASLPPSERSPEAAAFVTSASLLRHASRLLHQLPGSDRPAAADGAGAAADPPRPTSLGRSRLLLAILLIARADHSCPQTLLSAWDVGRRLASYMCCLPTGGISRLLSMAGTVPSPQQEEEQQQQQQASPQQQQQPSPHKQQQQQQPDPHKQQQQQQPDPQKQQKQKHAFVSPQKQQLHARPPKPQRPKPFKQQKQQQDEQPLPPQQQQHGEQLPQQQGQQQQQSEARHPKSGGSRTAAGVLLLYSHTACSDLQREGFEAVRAAGRVAQMLAEPACRAAMATQLEVLAGAGLQLPRHALLLTAEQLQHACWVRVAERGGVLLAKHRRPSVLLLTGTSNTRLAPAQQQEIEGLLALSVRSLLQLDPSSLKGLMAAGEALASLGHPRHAAELRMRAFQLAASQGSEYWALRSAATLVGARGSSPLQAAAIVMLQEADAAIARCEQVLPEPWVQRLRNDVSAGRRRLATAQAELQMLRQLTELSSSGNDSPAGASADGAVAAAAAVGPAAGPAAEPARWTAGQPAAAKAGGVSASSIALRKQAAARLASQAFRQDSEGDGKAEADQSAPARGRTADSRLKPAQPTVGLDQVPFMDLDDGPIYPFTPVVTVNTQGP